MRINSLLPLDRITIDDTAVPGFCANEQRKKTRVAGDEFRQTNPTHQLIKVHSDGTHPAVPQKYTWINRFCFQRGLSKLTCYKNGSTETIILPHDCTVTKAALRCGEGIHPRTALPLHGIWLFVEFSKPGAGLFMYHRPLVEIPIYPVHTA